MAEFTWKFSGREKWIGRHPSLWFSVGRDSHRSAKGGYPDITISSFDVFYKNCGFYFLDGDWLWRISRSYSQEMMGVILKWVLD